MSKKKVSLDAIDDILGGAEEPQESNEHVEPSTKQKKASKGRPREEDYEARTFRVRKELVQKLRIISTMEGRLQKDILDFAMETVIARYEEKHGVIDISKNYGRKGVSDIF
jgi:hypothetical protein